MPEPLPNRQLSPSWRSYNTCYENKLAEINYNATIFLSDLPIEEACHPIRLMSVEKVTRS